MIASEQLATLSIDDVVLNRLVPAVMAAGEAIMKVKQAGFDVEQKSDHSPVTQADKAANALLDALSQFYPEIDVISGEAQKIASVPC